MSKKKNNNQLDFFSGEIGARLYEVKFKPGDIVRQNWPWIGHYQQAYVYFQICSVRYDCMDEESPEPKYQCEVVPRGVFPDMPSVIDERYLVDLGVWYPVPTEEEIKAEYTKGTRGMANQFLDRLNIEQAEQPYSFEIEMTALFDSWPVKWREVTRGDWYDHFPQDIEADNHIRKPRICQDCRDWFDALDSRFMCHFPKENCMRDKCFECAPEMYMTLDMDKFLCLKKKEKTLSYDEMLAVARRKLRQDEIEAVKEDDRAHSERFDKLYRQSPKNLKKKGEQKDGSKS